MALAHGELTFLLEGQVLSCCEDTLGAQGSFSVFIGSSGMSRGLVVKSTDGRSVSMQKAMGTNGKEKTYEYVEQPLEDRETPVKCAHEKGKHEHWQYQGKFSQHNACTRAILCWCFLISRRVIFGTTN